MSAATFPDPTHGTLEWTGGALKRHWGHLLLCHPGFSGPFAWRSEAEQPYLAAGDTKTGEERKARQPQ